MTRGRRCVQRRSAGVGPEGYVKIRSPRVRLVACGKNRRLHSPVGPDVGVVPCHAQFVRRVVITVDHVGDGEVAERRETVGDAWRYEHAEGVVGVDVQGKRGPVGTRTLPQVM